MKTNEFFAICTFVPEFLHVVSHSRSTVKSENMMTIIGMILKFSIKTSHYVVSTCVYYYYSSVYFEAVTWDDLSNGFEIVPGGTAYRNRSVLSYHFYEPPQVRTKPNSTECI